jgi:hypothetical protein
MMRSRQRSWRWVRKDDSLGAGQRHPFRHRNVCTGELRQLGGKLFHVLDIRSPQALCCRASSWTSPTILGPPTWIAGLPLLKSRHVLSFHIQIIEYV